MPLRLPLIPAKAWIQDRLELALQEEASRGTHEPISARDADLPRIPACAGMSGREE